MQRKLKYLNNPHCVPDAIDGLLLCRPDIKRLGNINVVIQSNVAEIKERQVTLISGGGSGHEPAHAGFVGTGMLTAAVLGNVFASPPVVNILSTIRACAGPHGVLVIVKNYTGDRLNFGVAVERAKAEGLKVCMVVVDDDAALAEGKGITGGRGVAGTLFIHKIAGAAALRGSTLEEVSALASKYIGCIRSLGCALQVGSLPGSVATHRLCLDEVEMGVGIHGEPGDKVKAASVGASSSQGGDVKEDAEFADRVVDGMLDQIMRRLGGGAASTESVARPVAVLINNLGGCSELEMAVLCRSTLLSLHRRGLIPVRCYAGSLMTSLDTAGVSLSVLDLRAGDVVPLLDGATTAAAWRPSLDLTALFTGAGPLEDRSIALPQVASVVRGGPPCSGQFEKILHAICSRLSSPEVVAELTRFDSAAGDGDCGIVMEAGARAMLQVLSTNDIHFNDAATCCSEVADVVGASMGGTSGVLLEIMLRAMGARYLSAGVGALATQMPPAPPAKFAVVLRAGVDAVMQYGGASVGMRTLLDALVPAVEAFEAAGEEESLQAILSAASAAATTGMEGTRGMRGCAGRANYVADDSLAGIPDPGAFAVAQALQAAAAVPAV